MPSKISLVVKKDTLSSAQILTLSGSTVQLPLINKIVSAAKLTSQPAGAATASVAAVPPAPPTNANQQNDKESESVKRLKTTDEIAAV